MNTRTIIRRGAVAVVAATLLNASPAAAQLGATSVDCRAAIAKNYGKLLKSANKVIAGCHKSRDKDVTLVAMDCNDMAVADLEKGKYLKASDKFDGAVLEACPSQAAILTALNVGGGTEFYVSCPVVPCAGVSGVIDSIPELTDCMSCEAAAIAEDVATATLGLPNPADLSSEEQKCHGAIAKGYGKYLSAGQKNDAACQGDADEAGDNTLTSCFNTPAADPKGKTAGALTKAGEGLDKSCVGVNLADLDSCSAVDLTDLKNCNATLWADAEDDAFTTTYELPATGCPNAIRTTIVGGCSTQGSAPGACSSGFQTGTSLSVGWKGLAHGVDITDSYGIAVDVTCGGTEKGSCTSGGLCAGGDTAAPDFAEACANNGDCTLGNTCQNTCVSTGISYDNPQYTDFTRCAQDPARSCDAPFTNDLDCGTCVAGINVGDPCETDGECPGSTCAAGSCRYYLGPPLSVSAGGTPTCTLNVVNTDVVGGTGNPDTGEADFLIDLRAVVHLGTQSRPCPYCRSDPTPQDGNRTGVCTGGTNAGAACSDDDTCTGAGGDCTGNFGECIDGPHDGDPCDVQGFDLTFANPQRVDLPDDGNSLDCPPNNGANVSGGGLVIALPLTTGVSTKDATDPCESPLELRDCFCGVCSGDGTIPCDDDADCAAQLLGSCGFGGGVERKPNYCTDVICTAVSSDRGECQTSNMGIGDVDTYCNNMLFANGHGILGCGTDSDCEAYETGLLVEDDWVCPNDDCGACDYPQYRSCFNDPISVTGTPDPVNPILVGTFCLPPSSNGSVNSATGSPGPGVVQTDSIVELRY